MDKESILVEIMSCSYMTIATKEWKEERFEVCLHKVSNEVEGLRWEGIASYPFKWIGFLTKEEVGQFMGGS